MAGIIGTACFAYIVFWIMCPDWLDRVVNWWRKP